MKLLEDIKTYLPTKLKQQDTSEYVVKTYYGEDTWVASASYIPFVSAAVLVLRKNNNEFVSFHARQALVILLFATVIFVLLPSILKFFFAIIVYMILVYGAYQAIRGRKWFFPIVTQIANTFDL